MSWSEDQEFESGWWGDCSNTFQEENKQIVYAKKMGIPIVTEGGKYPVFILTGNVLDMGGGPVSILLKSKINKGTVVDPCIYPDWIENRYTASGITYLRTPGEDFTTNENFDEGLIYNVLQHVQDPKKVIQNTLEHCKILRIFEWIENGVSIGHPNNLTESELNEWLGGEGRVEQLNESGCHGLAYFGVFKGKLYEG